MAVYTEERTEITYYWFLFFLKKVVSIKSGLNGQPADEQGCKVFIDIAL